jgi:hypothetical protein
MKLSYDSTISRHLVHRAAVAEVLLTDWRQMGADTFVLAAQWPRGHLLYSSRDGHFDPLLAAETLRQAGILLAHVGYRVPQDHAFLMQRLIFECVPERLHSPRAPLNLVVTADVSEVLHRACTISGMRIDVTLLHDDDRIGWGSGWLRCVPPRAYERLRWAGAPREPGRPPAVTPADPATVGRRLPADVVVGPPDTEGSRRLRVPIDHPVFFDHPLDHVPGILAIEAMRQTALATIGRPAAVVIGAEAAFPTFLHFDRKCTVVPDFVRAAPDRDVVGIRCIQDGVVAVHGQVALSR